MGGQDGLYWEEFGFTLTQQLQVLGEAAAKTSESDGEMNARAAQAGVQAARGDCPIC